MSQTQAAPGEGSRARLALALLLYTGQRRSDVVRMGWQHIRDDKIAVTQDKRNPGAPAKTLKIQIHEALQAELDRLPKTNMTFIMTEYGKPMTKVGFTNWFRACAKEAGLPDNSSPHGLRKAASRWLAEAGCSTLEIAAITGHSSLKEVERYSKRTPRAPCRQRNEQNFAQIKNIGCLPDCLP